MDERERITEENYLRETLSFIDERRAECTAQLQRIEENLRSIMQEQREAGRDMVRDFDDVLALNVAYAEIGQTDRSRVETEQQLARLEKQRKSPYFGRVDLLDEGDREEIYIGLYSLRDPKSLRHYVHDWRAPVSEPFYTCDRGGGLL